MSLLHSKIFLHIDWREEENQRPPSFSPSNQFSYGAGSANIRYSILPPATQLVLYILYVSSTAILFLPVQCTVATLLSHSLPLLGGGIIVAGCDTCQKVRHRYETSGVYAYYCFTWSISIHLCNWPPLPPLLTFEILLIPINIWYTLYHTIITFCRLLTKLICDRTGASDTVAWRRPDFPSALRPPLTFPGALLLW